MKNQERIIVVVDRDEDRATTLSSQLDRRGFHVIRRSSGIDALQCVAECRPDLVLSESELLDLDCPELVHSIHEASPETRVLFVERRGGIPHISEDQEHHLLEQDTTRDLADEVVVVIDVLPEK